MGSSGETSVGSKITIGEARACGAAGFLVNCMGAPIASGGCRHASEITMMLAVALWGDRRQLDDVRLRCSLCGSTRVELRPHYEFAPSSNRS